MSKNETSQAGPKVIKHFTSVIYVINGTAHIRHKSKTSKEYRLLKGALFASVVLSMAAATKKEKKRRSLPLEASASSGHINKT